MSAVHPRTVRFIEQFGRLAEGEGLPRIAGRMMGLLMVNAGPMSIDALASQLRVSRASISTNGKLLRSMRIAERFTEPGDRRDYLQLSGDPCSALLSLGVRRLRTMRDAVREMRRAFRGRQSRTRERLRETEKCYDAAVDRVESLLSRWGRAR